MDTHRHRPSCAGFTLVELLIVIAIIATLAGLLIPAVTMIKGQVNDVKCSNNLRQLATALIAYQSDHQEIFPGKLLELFTPSAGYGLHGLEKRILVCPKDRSNGASSDMGREYFTSLGADEDLRYLYESGCSYLYEVSSSPCTGGPFNYFYSYNPGSKPAPGSVSWFEAKQNQLKFGYFGNPMPPDRFPIIRCFHHHRWAKGAGFVKKVNNVSWNGNVFWSVTSWEYHVDPNLTTWLK
jgi:prepilin-type N-terminal cleavage/methylation domain-containing protein